MGTSGQTPRLRYEFICVARCEMCGSSRAKVLGLRLNRSQGRRPRQVSGIGVTVMRCRDCGLVYSNPRPRPHDLSDHYGVPPESYWTSASQWEMNQHTFSGEIAQAKRLLTTGSGHRALDIGAGLGKAMKAMERAGFDVYGIEPSAPFRLNTINRMGISPERLQLAAVEDARFPPASFDFVTFGAVLEHIQEPGRAIETAMQWLKPGGVMHAEVPSSDYLVSKIVNAFFALQGLNYVTNLSPMHTPFHLYEFGLESFRLHGRSTGYEIAHHEFYVCAIPHLPAVLHPPLRWWMRRNQTGMQLAVYLRKTA
jgi:2-polyprenyl-3-methyl-5-hydroxy-6-metoxy-1,4-benzoquinol methylase